MGLDVGGFKQGIDWPKLGPSLVIATSLILAIRKARSPAEVLSGTQNRVALNAEIAYCADLAAAVMRHLVTHKPSLFSTRPMPWYVVNEEDEPK